MKSNLLQSEGDQAAKDIKYKIIAIGLFTGITAVSLLAGFSRAFVSIRRHDLKQVKPQSVPDYEDSVQDGVWLACKALGIATILSVSGVSLISYSIWKLSGASNFKEFRYKMGSILPKISSDKEPVGRTEFDSLSDLLEYLATLKSVKDIEKETK